jgi:uncharacterized protein YjlB
MSVCRRPRYENIPSMMSYDLRTGEEGERPEVLQNIRNVSLPKSDPLFGERGLLLQRWSG